MDDHWQTLSKVNRVVDLSPQVLDQEQLQRIQAVHRGFLYQHLYATGCLLTLMASGGHAVRVERDEDVEVEIEDGTLYFQIKTRKQTLHRADIEGTLERFEEIRRAHHHGNRTGSANLRIITNVPPSEALLSDLLSEAWPSDVCIIWPGGFQVPEPGGFPPAWPNLVDAVAWCTEAARSIPFKAVEPETLVWKLAARVQFAATGGDSSRPAHTFSAVHLPTLFEQIIEQLQEFPAVPPDYRHQMNEPSLDSSKRLRIIAALSGAGKTTWASQVARHCGTPTVYFDIADLPGPAIASSLARELIARFLGGHGGAAGAAILPVTSGLEMLRALDLRLDGEEAPIVVLDNAHRAEPRTLYDITGACLRCRFVFLVQPWPGLVEAEALFDEQAEWLTGWDAETVAAEFASTKCKITPATAERWRLTTAGMPLFVKNAARLSSTLYGGDAERFLDEVDREAHTIATAQETILSRVIDTLSSDARMALATLSLSSAPLSRSETESLLGLLPSPSAPWGRALRELTACGGLQVFADTRLKVHDAMSVLGRALQSSLPPSTVLGLQTKLRDLLFQSLKEGRDLVRLGMWLRLLPKTGALETLVDLATQEIFHEIGDPTDLKSVLEAAVQADDDLDDNGRFWALDALAFWDWQSGERGEVYSARVSQMQTLIENGNLGKRERLALAMKQMTAAAECGDPKGVSTAFYDAKRHCHSDPPLMRILRYNHAIALFHLGRYRETEEEVKLLCREYYKALGLDPANVFFRNLPQIVDALGGNLDGRQDDLKHLADCLDLYARCRRNQGLYPGFAGVHALKFYVLAQAYRSAIKTGQEVVDDFIAIGDSEAARQIMEGQVLPIIREYGLTANMLPVRAQYAVVLAYCGDSQAARQEMRRLQPFEASLTPEAYRELQGQRELIEVIDLGLVQRVRPFRDPSGAGKRTVAKVGRNDLCPCGSGKKYKKCCLQ